MQKNKTKELNLQVIAVGEPNLTSLPDYQAQDLYSVLLRRIAELANGGKDNEPS